jgi:hypothetical protein
MKARSNHLSVGWLGVLVILAVMVAGVAGAQAPPCPDNFLGYGTLGIGKSLTCTCSAEQLTGSVWGTDRYTGDSSICAAARHAAVVGASGGKVTVYREGSCPGVVGSTRHGVTSQEWGAFDKTFAFEHPAPACMPEVEGAEGEPCPANMLGQEGRSTTEALECTCAPQQMTGSVWGSDLYTFDSSVCGAARHAGMIPAAGGAVTVFAAGRCPGFKGTTRNGVTSGEWGVYEHSFAFRFPLPKCADGSTVPKQ